MKNANVPSFDAFDALMIEIIKYSNSVSSDVLFFLIISIPLIFENSRTRIFVFLNPLV